VKISIGARLHSGPWGGANQFCKSLSRRLEDAGHEVRFDLATSDIDIILMITPHRDLGICAYSDREIFEYLSKVNSRAIVVHRVNDCDERKGTTGVNARMVHANLCADHTVFVGSWLSEMFLERGWPCQNSSVILNGADRSIFNAQGHERRSPGKSLRLVTHHWGAGWLKGFDIYKRLDEMLADEPWRSQIDFTYIGNLPEGLELRHSQYLEPRHGVALADELRKRHVYLTASQHEPGGNHQNEGACCGLPLLYRNSGCMPEYCGGYGVMFDEDDFEAKLREMLADYDKWSGRIDEYPHDDGEMSRQYIDLFLALLNRREEILDARRRSRWLRWRLLSFWQRSA